MNGPSWANRISGMEDQAPGMDGNRNGRYCRCGTRLARDHAASVCVVCERVDREARTRPPEVPPTFWQTDQLRDALAARHLGQVIRAYRTHPHHGARPLSQELVASWAGLTQAQLSRMESGPAIQDLDRLIRWARLLGIPQRVLWFDLPESSRKTVAAVPGQIAAVPAASFATFPAHHGHEPMDDFAAMTAFRAADRQVGGGHLYANVVRYLERSVGPRLFGSATRSDGSVFSAAAALTEMAGWMAHDVGQDEKARHHFDRALSLATAGPDPALAAAILASQSHLAYEQRDMTDAVSLARQGQERAGPGQANPAVAARLWAMEARGLAATGERIASSRALDEAERVLGTTTVNQEPLRWTSPFDAAALATEAAECWRRLGDLRQAEDQARRAIALRTGDRTRSRAFGQLKLAKIHLAQRRYDEACAVAREALTATAGLSSVRVMRQFQELETALVPLQGVRVVGTFTDELRSVLRERSWWYTWGRDNVS